MPYLPAQQTLKDVEDATDRLEVAVRENAELLARLTDASRANRWPDVRDAFSRVLLAITPTKT